MKFKILLLVMFSIQWVHSQVGINIKQPTRTLDVNGELRVRNIKTEKDPEYIIATDVDGVVGKKKYEEIKPQKGDVKRGFQRTDHHGWYLLDGRQISSLPTNASLSAKNIGYAKALPNATGKFLKISGNTQHTASTGGKNTVILGKNNLPKLSFSGETSSSSNASHNHSFIDKRSDIFGSNFNGTLANVGNTNGANKRNPHLSPQAQTTNSGNHNHSFKISNAGGNSQSFSIVPKYIEVNTFIYLGN